MPHVVPETDLDEAVAPEQERGLGWLLVIGGLIGLVAAVTLMVEKIKLIEDPTYSPSCDLNPVMSCGSVMATDQAGLFGFPNPIVGIAGFAIVAAIGAGLLAGARYAGWFWGAAQVGVTFGVVFVHWLIYQSLYEIGALCPYCMVVWAVMIPIFWVVTVRNLVAFRGDRGVVSALVDFREPLMVLWALVIIALIVQRFWDYWSTLG